MLTYIDIVWIPSNIQIDENEKVDFIACKPNLPFGLFNCNENP